MTLADRNVRETFLAMSPDELAQTKNGLHRMLNEARKIGAQRWVTRFERDLAILASLP